MLIMDETRSALVSQESVEARGVTTRTPAVAGGILALIRGAMLTLTRDNPVGVSLDWLELAYHIRYLAWLRAARLQCLDLLTQMAGEIGAIGRLEVAQ